MVQGGGVGGGVAGGRTTLHCQERLEGGEGAHRPPEHPVAVVADLEGTRAGVPGDDLGSRRGLGVPQCVRSGGRAIAEDALDMLIGVVGLEVRG